MNNKIDGASVLKTLIAFKGGIIHRLMDERKAAANALLCFELFPSIRRKAKNKALPVSVTESCAYDVMMSHQFQMEKMGIDEVSDYIDQLDDRNISEINSAYTAISEMLCDANELPIAGGKNAVDEIHKAILREATH